MFLRLPTRRFRKSALIPTRHLADVLVENPHDMVKLKQTLFGKIIEREVNDQKVTMSAKLRDVFHKVHTTDTAVVLLEYLFRDIRRIQDHSPISCNVGTVVTCSISGISEFGIETEVKVEGAQNIRGLIPKSSYTVKKEPEIGDVMCAVVIFVEHQFQCVELSPQPDLVQRVTLRKDKGHLVREGEVVKASVILRRSELGYVTMCVKTPNHFSGHLVHVPTRHHINDVVGFTDLFTMGETYSVMIKKNAVIGEENVIIGMLEKHCRKSGGSFEKDNASRKRQRVDSLSSQVSETSELESESKIFADTSNSKVKKPAVKKTEIV